MITAIQLNLRTSRHPQPASLGRWFDQSVLVRFALEAVQETESVASDDSKQNDELATSSKFRELLTLLIYCYATAVYGSRQIEFEATRDECIRYLAGNRELDANALRHFRRTHRERIQASLARLLSRAWERRATSGWSLVVNEEADAYLLASLNLKSSVEPVERFALDAAQRVGAAIQADSMALDD